MTSVSSSPNGSNIPWFCTNDRLRREFYGQGQKGTVHPRADGIDKPQEANQKQSSVLEDKTNTKKRNFKTANMKRRTTRMQKSQNMKTEEDNETNNTKMQTDKDEQYIEQEHIQPDEGLIMESESLELEPPLHDSPEPITNFLDSEETKESPKGDEKRTESENYSEESHDAEESNEKPETVKSEDDADVDDVDEEGGTVIRKFTRRTRSRVIITSKRPQTRKSQRKTTKGPKDGEQEHDFKGRDIVFVDPLDDKAEFWWPAMIVPQDEIDESMDVDGKLEENLYAGKFLVRYFEDMTYSVVEHKGLKHFIPEAEPYLTFENTCDEFSNHIGVRRALQCKTKGEPNKSFKWDYWKKPSGEIQEPTLVPTPTTTIKRRSSTANSSKSGTKSNYRSPEVEVVVPSRIRLSKTKSPVRRNSSSTRSKSSVTNGGNHSSQASHEGEQSEEESTEGVYIVNPPKSPSLGRRRKSESENIDSLTNTDTIKDSNSNIEVEDVDIEGEKKSNTSSKSSKRRRSSLTDKSDDGEQNSNNHSRNRKIKRVSAGESMDEEPTDPSPTTSETASTMVETMVEVPMEITETIIEASTEQSNEPLIEIMEEDNVPTTAPLTSPPLTIEDLSEEAQINIAKFNFDDPKLDSEAKEKLYDDAEEELRSLMKEWRALNRNLRKAEKELMSKRTRKLRNNEGPEDDNIDTEDDERDTNGLAENGIELVDSSDNENYNEDGEEHEDEEIQVVTRSLAQRKLSEDSKTSKGKRTLKKI